jgi:FKBP-type peptidyl-prolyl cis-trans isomerase FkpA
MPRLTTHVMTLFLVLAVAGCGGSSTSPTTTSRAPYSQTDLVAGFGAEATAGRTVTVSYAGWLYDTSRPDGKGNQFEVNTNFPFVLGAGRVIAGWDRGVLGMKVGGQRRLIIPPELAYGSSGSGPIPPNATILFDITLLAVQ